MFCWNKAKCICIAVCKSKEFQLSYLKYCLLLKWNWTNPLHINITEVKLKCVKKDQASFGTLKLFACRSICNSSFPVCFHPCFLQWLLPALSHLADVLLRTGTSLGQDWACFCRKGPSFPFLVLGSPAASYSSRRPQVYHSQEPLGSCQYPQTCLPPQQWQQKHRSVHKHKAEINLLSTVVSL